MRIWRKEGSLAHFVAPYVLRPPKISAIYFESAPMPFQFGKIAEALGRRSAIVGHNLGLFS